MFVYAEDVFVLNFIVDMLILCFVFKYEIKAKSKYILRILAIAVSESVLVVFLINRSLVFKTFGKMLLLFAVAWTASQKKNFRYVAGNFFLLMADSFVLCGAVLFVGNGFDFLKLSALKKSVSFVLGCVLSLAACFWFDRCIRNKIRFFPRQCSCSVCVNGKMIENIMLFADTGNLLMSASGNGIVVLSKEIFRKLSGLSAAKLCALSDYFSFYEALPGELKPKAGFKITKGVNGVNVYVTLKTDYIIIDGHSIKNALIMPGEFSGSGFDGIYNPIFFSKGRGEGYEL